MDWSDFEESREKDFRIYDSDGKTLLDYEIEEWDDTNQEAWIWVRIPEMVRNGIDNIWLKYGKSGANDAQNPEGVWKSQYGGVWHLNGDPSSPQPQENDSTSNNNHATTQGMDSGSLVSGRICQALEFDQFFDDDYLLTGSELGTLRTTSTLSAWIRTSQSAGYWDSSWEFPGLTGIEQAGGSNDIFWGTIDDDGDIGIQRGNPPRVESNYVADYNWHQVVFTWNSSTGQAEVYVDGFVVSSDFTGTGTVTNTFSSIGRVEDTEGSPEYYEGILDEFRISTGVRSPEWIEASYDCTKDNPDLFYQEATQAQ